MVLTCPSTYIIMNIKKTFDKGTTINTCIVNAEVFPSTAMFEIFTPRANTQEITTQNNLEKALKHIINK
jgi:hypothetical protein